MTLTYSVARTLSSEINSFIQVHFEHKIVFGFYRLPTELRDGNVFSRVFLPFCLSICLSTGVAMWPLSMMPWTSLYKAPQSKLPHPPPDIRRGNQWSQADPPPPIRPGTLLALPPATDIWWPTLETCSNAFAWGQPTSRATSSGGPEACTVCKRVVWILLKCFLL